MKHALVVGFAMVLAPSLVGCGGDDDAPPIEPTTLGELGPLVGTEGAGGFRFGVASAATQIEDQNPHTDWYLFTTPIADGGLGKGAAFIGDAVDGYSRALDDIDLLIALGVDSYRFSMEWARIEPQRDVIDEAALAHYGAVLDKLIANGIRPLVTIHHFSNPVWIDDPRDTSCENEPGDLNLCGLGHPTGGPLIVAEMAQHAQLLAERFGDRVDEWATVNEPINYLLAAYGVGVFPPGKTTIFDLLTKFMPTVRDYAAAHVAMYDAIKAADTVDADQDGVAAAVGFTLSVADWVAARDNNPSTDPADITAQDRLRYVYHYAFVDAVVNGTFDLDLDGVSDEDHPSWKDKLDWLGVQYDFRSGVTGNNGLVPVLGLTPCYSGFDFGSCVAATDPSYCVPAMGYEYYAPGLYTILGELAARYTGLPMVVSEGGIATTVGERRAENIVRTLEQIERARADGVDVRGYYHWSLMDNFEWAEGYAPKFGLYSVDEATKDRAPTQGGEVFARIIGARLIGDSDRVTFGGEGPMTEEPWTPIIPGFCQN